MQEMTAEARALRSEYMREWREKNPTKNAEYKARYWEKRAAELKAGEGEAGQSEKADN